MTFIRNTSSPIEVRMSNGVTGIWDMYATVAHIPAGPLAEIAKAEPDVQAIIAARVEAGEVFREAGKHSRRECFAHCIPEISASSCLQWQIRNSYGFGRCCLLR